LTIAGDVFLYIIYEGNVKYLKIGLNSQEISRFRDRYHTYYGEFKYYKYCLNHYGVEAKKIGHQIEAKFKKRHLAHRAYKFRELFDREDDDGKPLLSCFKRSLMTLIAKQDSKQSVRSVHIISHPINSLTFLFLGLLNF
jgi:hypothetical protein